MANDFFYALLPEQLVLGGILLLMVLEMLRWDARVARLAFCTLVLTGLLVLLQQLSAGFTALPVPGEVQVDRLALAGKAVLMGCALALAVGFRHEGGFKFWMLLASTLLGGLVVLGSAGYATLFIGIEMLSLPAFAMMVQGQRHSAGGEAAFKYLLMSSVGTALLLFGIALAYGVSGSLAIADNARLLAGSGQARAAGLLMLSGLFVKAAVFPFHAWAPDAYAGARLPVTAVLASLVKAAVVLALLRITLGLNLDGPAAGLVATLGIVSIVFGNLAALGQKRLKRLLAYSSVAHAGYMIFALLDTTGSRSEDLLWYVAFYAGGTLLACAAFARLCPAGEGRNDDELAALDGLFARKPAAALLLALAVLSLAGLPPFPGFFAKFFVFKSVIASGHLGAAIAAFVGSFLGLAVYLNLVLRLFRSNAETAAPAAAARAGSH